MAVRELIDMPDLTAKDRKRFVRRLQLTIPMDLDVLDIGGGLAGGNGGELIEKDQVQSAPLTALLRGLCSPGTWRTEPVDMDMESFLSSATRAASFAMTDTPPVRPNLAVVSKHYLNLHLLLGYHFNMVDCHLSEVPTANYIYFRFTGGVTEITRRSRRARVIAAILEEYEFGVETKGDLVIGRFRNAERERMVEALEMLGRLIGYTRQLDVLMRDDDTVREHTRDFIGHEPFSIDDFAIPENEGL
jgi:pyruvate,water dikinase